MNIYTFKLAQSVGAVENKKGVRPPKHVSWI